MSVTSGFFNSLNHDRLYDAEQLSSIFDGIIKDGVYMSYKDALMVKASDPANMTVIVGEGRAWFDHTWTLNDADLPLIIDTADVVLNRIDTIVIDVDATEDVRACTIIVVKGTPASQAVAPTLINETDHHQYPLCDISIPSSSTSITQAQITNRIGTSDCPFVTGIIETIDIDDLVAQWQAQWNEWMTDRADSMDSWTAEQQEAFTIWFQTVQDTLDEDTAGNLYNLITNNTGINATATYTSGVVAITAPTDAAIITFLAPSDFLETDTYTLNGTSINITDLNNEPIEEAWKEDSPVTLTISAGKAFFKAGGAKKLPDNLPPLNPNFALEVQPSGTSITVTADKLLVSLETSMLAGGVWVAKQSGVPTGPDDGTQIKAWGRNDLIYYGKPGVALSTLPEGTIVKLNESGTPVDFYVAKHHYENGLNGAGRTLLVRKDIHDLQIWDIDGVNAYAESDIDSWFNTTYKALLDESIQEAIGTTKFYYTPGNGNDTVGTLERAIFALSLTELGQSDTGANVEGSALPVASTLRIAYYNGSATIQCTRSPYTNRTDFVYGLSHKGTISAGGCASFFGFRPAFTLPSTTKFLDNGDGTYVYTSGAQTAAAGDTDETVSWTFDWPADTPCYVRQYTYNYKGQYQTMLEGAVVSTEDGPAYSAVLAENTWSMIAQAVADKDPILDVWQIGDTKDENIAGETLTFAIMGKNMDDLADGSGKAGLTFGMTQLMASTRQMNSSNTNSGSFAGSAMYRWLSGTIYPNLPTELKDAIKAVNKKTSSESGSSAIRTDAMYLWLFSEIEVFGKMTYSYAGEGTQYPYFATAAERIKKLSNGAGAVSYWWERSPDSYVGRYFCSVTPSGAASNGDASYSYGVCFGFCI